VRVRLPSIDESPHVWLDALDAVRSGMRVTPVLFVLADAHCAFVAHHAERLRDSYRFVLPAASTMDRILDKRQQYAAALEAQVSVPETRYPESLQDVERLALALEYPVILKPCTAHIGRPQISNRKVVVVHAKKDLLSEYAACTASGARFMIQAIIPGGDDDLFWYSGFWDEHGRERAWLTVQKLRQYPPGFGDGCFQRTVDIPGLAQQSRRLLEAFQYRGLVTIEFKRNRATGELSLMEINPRTVSGNQLGISAGVDLPWIVYRHLAASARGNGLAPPFQTDLTSVHEDWDVQSFRALRESKELTFTRWLWSLRRARVRALFAWDDPGPFLIGLWRLLARH
jgi:predicted ATP-grasp superfamily ATP-dependent carboligase